MKNKQQNYKISYSNEEHALEMFDLNYEYFDAKEGEFDIVPYSEEYYRKNRICFRENDGFEVRFFISILKEKGYIEETGAPFNIVRITEKGKKRIYEIKVRKSKSHY